MTPHLKAYMNFHGYRDPGGILCEVTGKPAQDIMHLTPRGMGGSTQRDTVDNLMAAVRPLHDIVEKYTHLQWWFKAIHKRFVAAKKPGWYYAKGNMDPFLAAMTKQEYCELLGPADAPDFWVYLTSELRTVVLHTAPGKKPEEVVVRPKGELDPYEYHTRGFLLQHGLPNANFLDTVSRRFYYNVPLEMPRGVDPLKVDLLQLLPQMPVSTN